MNFALVLSVDVCLICETFAGLLGNDSSWDLLETALLASFCAIYNHGFEMLFSFSAVVQHTPSPPIGFSILKAGLNKSVLLSVYETSSTRDSCNNPGISKLTYYIGFILSFSSPTFPSNDIIKQILK